MHRGLVYGTIRAVFHEEKDNVSRNKRIPRTVDAVPGEAPGDGLRAILNEVRTDLKDVRANFIVNYDPSELFCIFGSVAGIATVAVQLWRRNSLVSILAGTILYMLLLSLW